MESLLSDIRSGVRQLIKHPGFACIAVLTLALGIGANTAVFTMVDAMLFKPISAAHPERLVWIAPRYRALSYLEYQDFRSQAKGLTGLVAYGRASLALGGANPARVNGQLVSANYFELLGVRPALGRGFVLAEDSVGRASPVAVMSHALWRGRFAADSGIVGRNVVINGRQFTIVGVAPAGFSGVGLGEPADLFLPIATQPYAMPGSRDLLTNSYGGWLRVIGRMADGVRIEQADAEITRIAMNQHPARNRSEQAERSRPGVQAIRGGLDPSNRREAVPIMSLIMVVPLLVLLIACANVANMLLARGMARRKELAVRRALGGGRARIVRQLLTEALILALAAGGVGIAFAFWLTGLIVQLGNVPAEVAGILTPDMRVLVFTGLTAALTTVVFGLVPALSATAQSLSPALKNDVGSVTLGRARHRLRDSFVVIQLAMSLLLLVTAGLFLRSLDKALHVDPGFDPRHRVAVSFDLELQGYTPEARTRFYQDMTARASALPGVQSVAYASLLPLTGRSMDAPVKSAGMSAAEGGVQATFATVSPRYFETLNVPLLQGREFSADDRAGGTLVVIVNATLARWLWGAENPVGKQLRFSGDNEPLREVVGVVRNGKYGSLTEDPQAALYLPPTQFSDAGSEVSLVVHAPGSGPALVTTITRMIKELDPNLPLSSALTLDESLRQGADKQQAAAAMLGIFGALALVLAALGLYGVTAHGVALRTREIGIRMALGAKRSHVLSLFVHDGVRLAAIGVAAGWLLSVGVSRLLSSMLFGLSATDVTTFLAGAAVLCATALLAAYIPARRAARVDPVIAMRAE